MISCLVNLIIVAIVLAILWVILKVVLELAGIGIPAMNAVATIIGLLLLLYLILCLVGGAPHFYEFRVPVR